MAERNKATTRLDLSEPDLTETEGDKQVVDQAIQALAGVDVRRELERRYGDGWLRALSHVLGIAASTLSGWLAADEMPRWAQLSLSVVLSARPEIPRPTWHAVRDGERFQVVELQDGVGRIIASDIPTKQDALLIAAAPLLEDFANHSGVVLGDMYDSGDSGCRTDSARLDQIGELLWSALGDEREQAKQ